MVYQQTTQMHDMWCAWYTAHCLSTLRSSHAGCERSGLSIIMVSPDDLWDSCKTDIDISGSAQGLWSLVWM